jgi:tetratricopeptide (TPR) repeat protein
MENVFSDNRRTKIKWLLEALKFENDAPYALNDLGNLYSDLNKLDSAVYYLQKAIDAAPKWSIPYMNIGLQYENLKDFPNAIGFYQKSIQLDSTNADVYDDLGVYYQVANDYENALLNHKKALHFLTSKTNFNGMEALPITYYDLGYDYQKLKQNDRAVASYQKAIDIDSNYAAAHNGLGSIYQAAGDYDRALACYKKTIKLDSAYSTAYFNIGAIYLGRQSFEAAVRYYSKGLSLDTTHAGPYYYIALTYQSIGDNDKAFVNMRKSFALDSTNINCRILLGYFYVVEKDIKKGVSVLHSAMQLNPQDPVSNYNLACGWSLANEISNGLYCLRLALDEGFHSYDQLKQDGDIGNLRKTAEFNLLIKKYFPDKIK